MPKSLVSPDLEVPVLIVGGGGAGLTASMLLSRLGIDAMLFSSLPGTSVLPKAHLLNQHTMEIFRALGIAETVYEQGTPAENMRYSAWYAGFHGPHAHCGREIARVESWDAGATDPRWLAASPCRQTNLPQLRLEPIMRAEAEKLAPGRIRFHHEVTAVEQDADGVTAWVTDKDSGEELRVRARYLLACDGGRTIGRLLGVSMEGLGVLARVVTVHMTADLSPWASDPEVLIRWHLLPHTGSGVALIPAGPRHWGPESKEWICHLNYPADDSRALDDDTVLADMHRALGLPGLQPEVHVISRWIMEGVVADRFRVGRVFLLGDAAHRHPPTGGLGLNAAVQDAHNLCWKLATVLGGRADQQLLDSYEAERRPTAARYVTRSIENAANQLAILAALELDPHADPDANWAQLARLWSGAPEDADYRGRVRSTIAAQSMEFDEHNVEYGFSYTSNAVVPDGTPPPEEIDDIRLYQPTTRPGHPLPHAWLQDQRGVRRPLMDFVPLQGFLLIAGEQGQPWCDAADEIATATGIPLRALRIGHLEGDVLDPRSSWAAQREITPAGALLVRPDRVVSWRCAIAAADPVDTLRAALDSLLGVVSGTSDTAPAAVAG